MDAQLNDLIRLKQPPAAPVERWQRLPTRERLSRSVTMPSMVPPCSTTPLRPRNTNMAALKKTPEQSKFQVKYRHTPKAGMCKTPSKTPKTQATKTPGGKTPHGKKTPPKSGKKKTPGRSPTSGCRFIPNRTSTDMEYSSYLLQKAQRCSSKEVEEDGEEEEEEEGGGSPSKEEYQQSILKALSRSQSQKGVLSFTSTTPSIGEGSFLNYTASMSASFNGSVCSSQRRSSHHTIPTGPMRILDAPALLDDYYLNTLDWSRTNKLAIGLGNAVFLWNASDGSVQQLMEMSSEVDYVSSVSWAGNGKYLAIGGSDATIQLWDVEKERKVRSMKGHSDRVGVLTWNSHMLTSGCRDGAIHHHDVRKPEHCVSRGYGHCLEVCGLKWSPDGRYLASGGNDNLVCVWNVGSTQEPRYTLRGHQAAVKAVSWCPWQPNMLATGGGTSDKCIKVWNVSSGQCTDSVDTKSQVSAISWNREYHEMITAHGQPKNQMTIWKFPSLAKVGELCGHQGRILHMSLSPRKTTVASAGSDETLRIWKCFERSKKLDVSKNQTEDNIVALLHSVR